MVDPIFPPNEIPYMSDKDWETYCCQVWCNNSLNAVEGCLRHHGQRAPTSGDKFVVVHASLINSAADQLRKAQAVINFLLRDSGRIHCMAKEMEEFGFYTICFYASEFDVQTNEDEGFDGLLWMNVPKDIFDKWFDREEFDMSKEEWFKTYTADNTVSLAQYIQEL